MNIKVNAEVYCIDGFYGHMVCIILNPTSEQVTHVTVRKDGLFSREWLVPVSHIVDSTPARIELDLSKKDLETRIPPFIKTEFLESDLPNTLYTTDLMWPHLIANLEMRTLRHENIPLNEMAVHGGAMVEARDGVIGRLENFVVDPDDKHVTQIVIRAGNWHAHSRVAIPVSAIDHFDDHTIYLALDKQEVEALTTA